LPPRQSFKEWYGRNPVASSERLDATRHPYADAEFLSKAREIYAPASGTELMRPFLYALVRSTRPKSLLEIGAGYTTAFLLRALSDNIADVHRERGELRAKNQKLLSCERDGCSPDERELRWLSEAPANVDPAYYLESTLRISISPPF
jgi:hypothetical protein